MKAFKINLTIMVLAMVAGSIMGGVYGHTAFSSGLSYEMMWDVNNMPNWLITGIGIEAIVWAIGLFALPITLVIGIVNKVTHRKSTAAA